MESLPVWVEWIEVTLGVRHFRAVLRLYPFG